MRHHRLSHLFITFLLVLDTSAASFAATVIYAQTIKGVIYKSTDSAMTWQAAAAPTLPNTNGASQMLAVDPLNTDNLYTIFVTPSIRGQSVSESGINRSTGGGQSCTGTVLAKPLAATRCRCDHEQHHLCRRRSTDYGVTWALLVNNSTVCGNPSGSIRRSGETIRFRVIRRLS